MQPCVHTYRSAFYVGRRNKLFLARLSLHAHYTVRMTLQSVDNDGNDGLARPYTKTN